MPPARAPQDLVHLVEAVRDHTLTEDPAVTKENTVDLLQALTAGRVLDRVPVLTAEVVVVADLETEVTTERDSSDRIITAALITSHVSKVSITLIIVAVAIISKIVIDSIIISITIASAIDVAVVLTIAVADADVAETVAVDSSTVSRASAISVTGETLETAVLIRAIDTAIVVIHRIQ